MPAFLICILRYGASLVVDMKVPYTRSGKCGGTVWQRNRYGALLLSRLRPFEPPQPGSDGRARHLALSLPRLWGVDRGAAHHLVPLRPADPYKNKCVRYSGERLKKKVGKTGAK